MKENSLKLKIKERHDYCESWVLNFLYFIIIAICKIK